MLQQLLVSAILVLFIAPARAGEIHLNEIQVVGSHNSYHVVAAPAVMELIAAGGKSRGESIDYSHPPLAEQFSRLGIRQIELDVFADPDGGRFAKPVARSLVKALKRDPGPDPNANGVLDKPGLKVLHFPDFDFQTTTPTFIDALRQVREWSKNHPRHVPILVLVELKDGAITGIPTTLAPFDAKALDGVDAEILSVFAKSEILIPDHVRGAFATLPEAIKKQGWPSLEKARGKVMFALDNEGTIRDRYLQDHPALKGRVMFATAPSLDHPAAAWFKINDPVGDFEKIREAVRRGFLVRTRADADTVESRKNDPSRRDKALASGAQFVSTDFAEARKEWSPYRVSFAKNAVARANPVSLPHGSSGDLESLPTQKP
jgi:hypothetical protein